MTKPDTKSPPQIAPGEERAVVAIHLFFMAVMFWLGMLFGRTEFWFGVWYGDFLAIVAVIYIAYAIGASKHDQGGA